MRVDIPSYDVNIRSIDSMLSPAEIASRYPVDEDMAKRIEEKCNEMEKTGYRLISSAITGAAKAILIFHKDEDEINTANG